MKNYTKTVISRFIRHRLYDESHKLVHIKIEGKREMYTQPVALRSVLDPKYLVHCLSWLYRIGEWIECLYWLRGLNDTAAFFLREYASGLKARIQDAVGLGLDWGLCHGDLHGNNNIFRVGDRFIHYDFEFTAQGWRAYDLAQVKARKRQPAKDKQQELWESVLVGYRSIRSFSASDEQAVDLFMAVRRFWVMGLDVAFIPGDNGALDYGEDWLNGFIEEFRARN